MVEGSDRSYHEPVMMREVLALLLTDPDGIYLDGTLGGGGHAAAILQGLREGLLIGFDRDPDAIAACRGAFGKELALGDRSRLEIVHGSYLLACSREDLRGRVQGILLDLGVSSHQLDEPSRGFSYRYDAPLDLRFEGSTLSEPSAADLLATLDEGAIADILFRYGEERTSRRIARAIVSARRHTPIRTTGQLRQLVERCVHPRHRYDALSRVFQALRIAVNHELDHLSAFFECMPVLLRPGGRIVVITYHSLEDRIVKHALRSLERTQSPQRAPKLRVLTPKPLRPQQDEIVRNRRSRSAKLRAAERV